MRSIDLIKMYARHNPGPASNSSRTLFYTQEGVLFSYSENNPLAKWMGDAILVSTAEITAEMTATSNSHRISLLRELDPKIMVVQVPRVNPRTKADHFLNLDHLWHAALGAGKRCLVSEGLQQAEKHYRAYDHGRLCTRLYVGLVLDQGFLMKYVLTDCIGPKMLKQHMEKLRESET